MINDVDSKERMCVLSGDTEESGSLIRSGNPRGERTVAVTPPVPSPYERCALLRGHGCPCAVSPRDLSLSL